MRKVKKKNILNKIDDTINDKIDEIKAKREKAHNKDEKKSKSQKESTIKVKNNTKKYKEENIKLKNNNSIKVKNKASNAEKPKKKKRAFWKRFLTLILILCIIGVLAVAAFLGYIVMTAPSFNESDLTIKEQSVIYDIDGNIITTLAIKNEKREIITYDELPQVLIDAIIATEDSRFFQHNGVDLLRFAKATILQLLGKGDAGGASTLTMQTVKNMITKKDKEEDSQIQKVIRKFQDVYLSVFKIEKQYSKEEILEIYVNDNYLGGGYYGVKEASKYYFDKDVEELTLPEAALIAGLFQLPTSNNPYTNPEGALKRRNLVLDYMYNHEYITKEERDLAKKIAIEDILADKQANENEYQGYIDIVLNEVEDLTDVSPYNVPMKIYTTMERSIQNGLNKIFSASKQDAPYWKDDLVQGGVAIINTETGAIAAVGAGRNKTGARQFNYATQAYRQPGSTAKPLFDYGPGIEYNNFSSYQLFNDEPWSYTNGPSINNWDGKYEGLITARRALQISRNIPALKAFQQVGSKNSQKFVYSLGLDVALNSSSENYRVISPGVDNTINEAYSIGGAAEGFTPLTMASAYAAFSNGGYYIKPHTVTKIEFRESGEVKEFKNSKERVMKDSTAYIMNNILESAVNSGFNGGARVYGSHVAAKTGTSNFDTGTMKRLGLPSYAVNDLWTVAYTSKYSIAVWYGYEEATSTTYNTDGSPKDKLTAAVMSYIPKDSKGWSMPSSVVAVEVEKESWPAKLPSEYTPSDMKITEYFVRGTQPTEISERYQKLNDITNVNTVKLNNNSVTITWDYQIPEVYTDEYLKKYFSNSNFGKTTDKLIANRKEYNNNTLGPIGFSIYREESDGTQTLIDFSKENSYTYEGYGNTVLIIKAEHEKYKSNASAGKRIEVNLAEQERIVISINGISPVTSKIGEYTELGVKNIYVGTLDITNTAEIDYEIEVNNTTTTYQTTKELEEYINTLPAGSYTITYKIKYLGRIASASRTIKLT